MDWLNPKVLLLALPLILLLIWFDSRSSHPMSMMRRRFLLVIRSLLVLLALLCLASPARVVNSRDQAAIFVLDHTLSEGEEGIERIYAAAEKVRSGLPSDVKVGYIAEGSEARVMSYPGEKFEFPDEETRNLITEEIGSESNLARSIRLAKGIFPSGAARHVILISDGQETVGSATAAAREAAVAGVKVHTVGVAGEARPDVRITKMSSSQSRLNEGATLKLTATVESSIDGTGNLILFENGLRVDETPIEIETGQSLEYSFVRSPDKRNIYNYRAVVEDFSATDSIPENNEALTIVDVRGKPLILYVEGEEGESRYLVEAMSREGIRLDVRSPDGLPSNLRELAGYDAVILSDIPAHEIGDERMGMIRDYVEKLGGGFVMVGGMNSFGVGGYYRTPIEEILPVKLKAPDQEEFMSSALALVMDRSGSMSGQKIEICKSAAIATAELLNSKDYLGVFAFDSAVHQIVPMTRVTSTSAIANQIASLSAGGGTNIYPGMATAREELGKVKAKIKHMIVLTDGQTSGSGYQALASQCNAEGITISTVAVGAGAQIGLLQAIAAAGGGQSYVTMDPTAITRIFAQDTMVHTGRMIREEAFEPQLVERSSMLQNWEPGAAPPLLGYVKTNRKATAQVPLVTDRDDPLLAHWPFGLGKVTAFTSDAKSRWAALWVTQWDGYSKLWSQVLRETARAPQGQMMDLRLEDKGDLVSVTTDLLEDAGTRKNAADVEADVYFVPSNALGSSMKLLSTNSLEQRGPGEYNTNFSPTDPGVYLVRARSGARMVSAGYVHNPSKESATGQINIPLLEEIAQITGASYLENPENELELTGSNVSRYVELWPYFLMAFLVLLIADLMIRRWENVRGVVDQTTGWLKPA